MISELEIREILHNYNLGELESVGTVYKNDTHSYCAQITTSTENSYFLKVYTNKSGITPEKFQLLKHISDTGYPVPKLYKLKKQGYYIPYKEYKVAIFELIEEKEKLNLNVKEVYELAKGLAKLHKIAKPKNILLESNTYNLNYFQKYLASHNSQKAKAPKDLQKVITYLYDFSKTFHIPESEPKAIIHVEFTPEHTRFVNEKLVAVIDFDEMSFDYRAYDIGNALISCFDDVSIDYNKMMSFLKGYESELPLTNWEKNNIFHLLVYGTLVNCTWNITDQKTDKLTINYKWPEDVKRVETLLNITKTEFDTQLGL